MGTQRLYEKYRPRTLDELVGQPKIVDAVRRIIDRDAIGGRAFWISGKSGTGKTCLAQIIAHSIADDFYVVEYTGRTVTPVALKDMRDRSYLYSLGKGGRAFIINEAHGLPKPTIEIMLDWLEQLPGHCVVIFTTTRDGQGELFESQIDAGPLLSRCINLALSTQGIARPLAEYAKRCAVAEGLDGRDLNYYVGRVNAHNGNVRRVLEEVEAGRMLED